jgi:hypothetical protein
MKSFILCLLIFVFGSYSIWHDIDNAKPTENTCVYISKNFCVLSDKEDKLEKVDISHIKQENMVAGQTVVYETLSAKAVAIDKTLMLFLFSVVLFIVIRVCIAAFRGGAGGGSFFDALDF